MDVARLILAAQETRIRLYSSLPWGYRLAELFTRLAVDTIESFGRTIMAEFLLRGVTGMPDPGHRWNPKSSDPAKTLPSGYGREFASRVYKTLIAKFRDPDVVDNAMMDFVIRFTLQGGSKHMLPNTDFKTAMGYVMTGVVNQGKNIVKDNAKRRQNEKPLTDEEDGSSIDVDDPNAFRDLLRLIPSSELSRMKSELAGVISWAPYYVSLVMQGYDDAEILGFNKSGEPSVLEKRFQIKPTTPKGTRLDQPAGRGWWSNENLGRKVREEIYEILREHLPEAA